MSTSSNDQVELQEGFSVEVLPLPHRQYFPLFVWVNQLNAAAIGLED